MIQRWGKLFSFAVILALLVGAVIPAAGGQIARALSPDLVISQVYGAGGNSGAVYRNDFVELFNRGTAPVSLAGKSIQYASATGTGNFGSNSIALLSGTLAPGQYYLVQLAGGANGVLLPAADATGTVNMSGSTGKVALVNSTSGLACNGGSTPCSAAQLAQITDLVGWGTANFFEGSAPAPATTATTAVIRVENSCQETDQNANDFVAVTPNPRNTASPPAPCSAGDQPPAVSSTFPANGAADFPVNGNLTVIFSEPVNVSGDWFTLTCSTSGAVTAGVSGGPTSFTLDPSTDLVSGESCELTLIAANITDQDNIDPPDNMTLDFVVGFQPFDICAQTFTPAYQIQGAGLGTPLSGNVVTTQGVVVGDHEGPSPALRGFYLQDIHGDGDETTSDAIFVFNGNNNSVALGQVVRVTGTAAEFENQTQLGSVNPANITLCGTGTIEPVDVTFPVPSPTYLEQYEGMLVRLPQTMYVTEFFQLGRFGQVVMSANARLQQPTNVVDPGAPALALQAANNLNRIIVDDSSQAQNPDPILFGRGGNQLTASNTLRGGDTATGMVGIMTYTWSGNAASGNAYRLRPLNALGGGVPDFQPTNPRPESAPEVGGRLRVLAMNLLNFFNTFDGLPDTVDNCKFGVGGLPADCRGADTQAEFDRQWPKTVAGIIGGGADVIGVNEIENDGYGSDSAIAYLVEKLNEATAPGTYAFIDVDTAVGQINALGTDAIKVGMIYKPAKVTPVGQTAVLNTVAFVNGGDGAARSRPSLAQAFQENISGARFVVDVNHLKSKSSACDAPDAGDGQGNCNTVRTNAAIELVSWLAADPTGTGDNDLLIMGDLNSYAKEDPVTVIRNAGFTNLIESYQGADAYSYVFDGQWGYLDHALGSTSILSQVTGVADWHINADEPSVLDYNTDFKTLNLQEILYAEDEFRISDHDVVLVGLNLDNVPPTLGPISAPTAPVAINSVVAVSADFTDPGIQDTHTATIDWGDGTITSGIVTESNGSGTINGTHSYSSSGVYDITITVTDNFGGSDEEVYSFIVVYDPSGGFVTGGGWLDSPPEAYHPDPNATGKANFGLVAKYKRGTSNPEGKFQFKLEEANLDFDAVSFDWLVITGSQARLRGIGTINGEGSYRFEILAAHGNPGAMRLRIWYEDSSGMHFVYDNFTLQTLGGGKIAVHR